MKLRLHEIELGVANVEQSHKFYSIILGLETFVNKPELKVFQGDISPLDFNISTHIKPNTTQISFLSDHLDEVIKKLQTSGIVFTGPAESHLGMISIQFTDPDGNLIRVN
ncbi:MAG: VOC family protein [Bacteroidota bacterium]